MLRRLVLGLFIVFAASVVALHLRAARVGSYTIDVVPCDKLASTTTQQTLRRLANYTSNPEAGILSGQNVGLTNVPLHQSFQQMWTKLHSLDCPQPAVMTVDLARESSGDFDTVISLFREHFHSGGLVGISMHPPNPWTGKNSWDRRNVSFKDLVTPGTNANRRYQEWLDGVADLFEALQEHDVTVLWRPLHEANGDWFWWCYGGRNPTITTAQYKQLWHSMHEYFHQDRQLHNLLWVYSPNALTGPEVARFDIAFPGSNYVDVAAIDYYGPNLNDLVRRRGYETLRRFGKVIALAEFGAKPWNGKMNSDRWLSQIRKKYPHFAYFCSWHSWPRASVALADLDECSSLLNDDFVVNLDDAPNASQLE